MMTVHILSRSAHRPREGLAISLALRHCPGHNHPGVNNSHLLRISSASHVSPPSTVYAEALTQEQMAVSGDESLKLNEARNRVEP